MGSNQSTGFLCEVIVLIKAPFPSDLKAKPLQFLGSLLKLNVTHPNTHYQSKLNKKAIQLAKQKKKPPVLLMQCVQKGNQCF